MIVLRDYQSEAISRVWTDLFSVSAALCVLPTGAGKTEIMIEFIRKAIATKPDFRAVIIVNKINLLTQTYQRFTKALGVFSTGIYCGSESNYSTSSPITIATIQSIHKIPLNLLHLIVLDEVHNVDHESGRYFDFIDHHRKAHPRMKIVAFTATPYRATGYIYGPGKMFHRISYQKPLKEMIDGGFLVPPRLKRVEHQLDTSRLRIQMGEFHQKDVALLLDDDEKTREQISDALPRMEGRAKVVWACASIKHCEAVVNMLRAKGEMAVPLHSKLTSDRALAFKKSFETGGVRHLVFVSIVSEGYDYPPIDCVVLMRPIRSPVLYVQTVGRGLRPSPGKKDLLVLDYGRVIETLGPIDSPMISSGRKGEKSKPLQMKFCPACLEYVAKEVKTCPACLHEFKVAEVDPTKNLTRKALDTGDIISAPPKNVTVEVKQVGLSKYVSKSGNECLRIDYQTNNFAQPWISEYFAWSNNWAQQRAFKRLTELACPFKADLAEQAGVSVGNLPKTLTYIAEKYPKIIRLNFV